MPKFAFKVSPKQSAESLQGETKTAPLEQGVATNDTSPAQIELALANCDYAESDMIWVQEFGSPQPAPDSMLDAAKLTFLAMAISTLEDEREPGLVVPELFDKFWSIELLDGEFLSAEEQRLHLKTPVVDALARDNGFASRTLQKLAKASTRSPKRLRRFSVRTMLVLLTLLAIGTAFFSQWYLKYERRAEAIETMRAQGWSLSFEEDSELMARRGESIVEHLKIALLGKDKTLRLRSAFAGDVQSLRPLQHLLDLEELNLSNVKKDLDLRPIARLKNLKRLIIDEPVFEDLTPILQLENLESVRAHKIGIESLNTIAKLKTLKRLDLDGYKSKTLPSSFKHLVNLEQLDLQSANVEDVSALDGLPNLKWLNLEESSVTNAPSNLKTLEDLNVARSPISNLNGLATCPQLKNAWLSQTKIKDLGWTQNLKSLQNLSIHNTQVEDLSPLQGRTNLNIQINDTQVKDLSPLKGNVEIYEFDSHAVENIDAIGTWPNLQYLAVDSPLVERFPKLAISNLDKIELRCPLISNLDGLAKVNLISILSLDGLAIDNLKFLKDVSVDELALKNMKISDLSPIKKPLTSLELAGLPIKSLEAIRKLKSLEKLVLVDLEVEDFSPIKDCYNLNDLRINNLQKSQSKYFYDHELVRLSLENSDLEDCDLIKGDSIQYLNLNNSTITDFTLLSRQKHLTYLQLKNTSVTNLDNLKGSWLRAIDLRGTKIKSLAGLASKPDFFGIDLSNTQGVDLSPLSTTKADNQGMIFLRHTKGYDLTPLGELEWLYSLDLSHSDITDLTPLSGCGRISILDLAHTQITSVDSLIGANLDTLNIAHTKVNEISGVGKLKLIDVDLSYTEVKDLTPLYECEYLNCVRIEGLPISDLQLEELKSKLPEDCKVLREESPRLDFYDEIDYYLTN